MTKEDPFYITTPIYYVNDKPHIGHAYTTMLADVISRYQRLWGREVYFLTGTDEHGQKVQQAAQAGGITPKEHVDKTVLRFKELWEKLNISYDDFIRTTEPRHKTVVQELLQMLYDNGQIYRADYTGWYCVRDERFYAEEELVEGKSPESGAPVELITESNYFFRMSEYQAWLIDYIQSNPTFIQPDFRRNETLGFLKKPLKDLCISRPKSRLSWGIELPFDTDYVTYVWFDALVNYISAPGYLTENASFEKWWPADFHLIGKDILTTHTVYWPTMLKAAGLTMPKTIFAHGWWLSGTEKMSKSEGNVVDPMDYLEKHGVDAVRYFLIAEMTLGQDASFTDDVFVKRYNSDLANDLGNLASRVIKMTISNFSGRVPSVSITDFEPVDQALWDRALTTLDTVQQQVEALRLDLAVAACLSLVREVNKYLEEKKPWALAKQGDKEGLAICLALSCEVLHVVSTLLYPVMPEKMMALRNALGVGERLPDVHRSAHWGQMSGLQVETIALFPRIQPPAKKDTVSKPSKPKPEKAKPNQVHEDGLLDIKDFLKADLRTAKIFEAERIEGSSKLLRLQIYVGQEKRQIVAGIGQHFEPEEVIGKTIVIVANLKPATIFGVESQGMLLAARSGERLKLITVDGDVLSGSKVG